MTTTRCWLAYEQEHLKKYKDVKDFPGFPVFQAVSYIALTELTRRWTSNSCSTRWPSDGAGSNLSKVKICFNIATDIKTVFAQQ